MSATRTSESGLSAATIFKRHIALPQDHGSWAFIISPLLIGGFAAGTLNASTMLLVVAALGAFLLRQPATIIVKIHSSRRSRAELPAAIFWFAAYSMVIAAACAGLATAGYAPLFWLGVPGVAIFAWHLHLVSGRSERKQAGVEIVAAGALALAAPASYWVGLGRYDPLGWWLWGLNWLQAASSIVYVYLRLAQRELNELPSAQIRWRMGSRAALYAGFNLLLTLAAAATGLLPRLIWLPYLLQSAETIFGITHPAIGAKPVRIGMRQVVVTSLFTILFIIAWRL